MKKIWQLFPLLVIMMSLAPLSTFSIDINKINNIYDSVEFIKESINFDTITIESAVPYDLVQNVIKKRCSQSAVNQASKELIPIKEARVSYLENPNINRSLSDRFDKVKWLIQEQKKENEYKYCKDSYLLFSILQTTQDLYTGKKEPKKVTQNNDKKYTTTDTVDNRASTESHWSAPIQSHNFTFVHNTDWLPNDSKKSFSETTEKYLQEILSDLVNIHILDEDDLKTLNNKIEVTYQQSCDITEWTFRAIRNKQTWTYTFKEISLIIAYCEKNNTPQRQKRHVQQILAHELWHYIYFFKDKNPSDFSEICWDNGKINCLPQEFISNYAMRSQEEDYAESFAYWYLYSTDWDSDNQHGSAPDNPINRRARYFEELFEREEEEEDDDEK